MKCIDILYLYTAAQARSLAGRELDGLETLDNIPFCVSQEIHVLPRENEKNAIRCFTLENGSTRTLVYAALPNGGELCSLLMAADRIGRAPLLLRFAGNQLGSNALAMCFDTGADCCIPTTEKQSSCELPHVQLYDGKVTMLGDDGAWPLAVAGYIYFQHGDDLMAAAKQAIMKGKLPGESFTVSDAVNEMILDGKTIQCFEEDA